MGFFSSIGKALKSIGKVALPVVGGILGGPLGAAAGGAISGAIGSGTPKLGNIVGGAAMGGLGGLAVPGLGSMGVGDTLKTIGKTALANKDLILGGLGAYESYRQGREAKGQMNEALDFARADYNARAPLRDQGVRSMLLAQQTRPDLSAIFANPGDPYTAPRMASVGRSRL